MRPPRPLHGCDKQHLTVTYTNQCGVSITDEVNVIVEEVNVTLASEGQAWTCQRWRAVVRGCVRFWQPRGLHVDNEHRGGRTGHDVRGGRPRHLGLKSAPRHKQLVVYGQLQHDRAVDTARFDVAGLPGTITCANPALELAPQPTTWLRPLHGPPKTVRLRA